MKRGAPDAEGWAVRFGGRPGEPTSREAGTAPRPDPYTEHPTHEGKVYCAVVLDTFSRRSSAGRSTPARPQPRYQRPRYGHPSATRMRGAVIHSHHGTQFTSWAFTDRAKRSGPAAIDGIDRRLLRQRYDRILLGQNQTELLNRKRWKTRIELANAIFDYLEIFHNRQRRHSALGMRTPTEFELYTNPTNPWPEPEWRHHRTQGTSLRFLGRMESWQRIRRGGIRRSCVSGRSGWLPRSVISMK